MIPNVEVITQTITDQTYPSRTYKIICRENYMNHGVVSLNLSLSLEEYDRINGFIDDIEAVIQAIYLCLLTERYKFIIYSWDYGVELVDLFGKPMPYVMSELPRRIKDALTVDDRIDEVKDFQFEIQGKKLHTTFLVVSNIGVISAEMGVMI